MICGRSDDFLMDDVVNGDGEIEIRTASPFTHISRIDALKIIEHLERVFDLGTDNYPITVRNIQRVGRAIRVPAPTARDLIDAGRLSEPTLGEVLRNAEDEANHQPALNTGTDNHKIGEFVITLTNSFWWFGYLDAEAIEEYKAKTHGSRPGRILDNVRCVVVGIEGGTYIIEDLKTRKRKRATDSSVRSKP